MLQLRKRVIPGYYRGINGWDRVKVTKVDLTADMVYYIWNMNDWAHTFGGVQNFGDTMERSWTWQRYSKR